MRAREWETRPRDTQYAGKTGKSNGIAPWRVPKDGHKTAKRGLATKYLRECRCDDAALGLVVVTFGPHEALPQDVRDGWPERGRFHCGNEKERGRFVSNRTTSWTLEAEEDMPRCVSY